MPHASQGEQYSLNEEATKKERPSSLKFSRVAQRVVISYRIDNGLLLTSLCICMDCEFQLNHETFGEPFVKIMKL